MALDEGLLQRAFDGAVAMYIKYHSIELNREVASVEVEAPITTDAHPNIPHASRSIENRCGI